MTTGMDTVCRTLELRQALHFVRRAHEALAAGDLRHAIRYHVIACRQVEFIRGLCHPGNSVTATATLCRVTGRLQDAIEDAVSGVRVVGHNLSAVVDVSG